MKNLLFLFTFLLISLHSYSQLDNSYLFNANSDSLISPSSKFGFLIDNVNYIRDTEYHSDIEQGATWAGTQIWPSAVYRYNKNISFKGGIFLQKDFGNNKFRTVIPTYTISYTNSNVKVNFGTLDGSLEHKLIEPMYAMENFIDKRIENGLQIKGKYKRLTYDQWIDWEKMIYRTSTTQEQFTVGFSGKFSAIDKKNFQWAFPVQITGRHNGGEIYAQPHNNIKTQFNFAYGTTITQNRPGKLIDKIDFQGYLTFYEDLSPTKADSFRDGTGQFLALIMRMKNFGIIMNYWDVHQYIAPLGDPYYVSKSREYPGDYSQYRKMVMLRLMYERKLWDNFTLVGRLNTIYDFSEKAKNMVMEVYLKFNIGMPIKP